MKIFACGALERRNRVYFLSRLWPVFRACHHDRMQYMLLRLKLDTKVAAGESNRLKTWPSPTVLDRFPERGVRFSSIKNVPPHAKLKGWWSNFGTTNCSIALVASPATRPVIDQGDTPWSLPWTTLSPRVLWVR